MSYKKNLNIEEIRKETQNFTLLPTNLRNLIIINYCRFHVVSHEDRKKIRDNLKIRAVPQINPREKNLED